MNKTATLALGLRSTPQGLGVIGQALGIFEAAGVDLKIAKAETAGPQGIRGLVEGDYQFAELGAVPAVQAALEGQDPLIVFAAEPVSAMYVLGGAGIQAPAALKGRSIGVLSASGQTGVSAASMLERWGLAGQVQLAELGTYPAIYAALAEGAIAAGVLTADYWLAGREAYGLSILADLGAEFRYQGPVLATTRRVREQDHELVQRVVDAYVGSLRRFKRDADAVVAPLQRHLGFVGEVQARAIHGFYAARFESRPFASDAGIQRVIDSFADRYPAARTMTSRDIHDPTFVSGALTRLGDE